MAKTKQVRGGIEVDGLAETVRALGKLDKQYKKEAVQIFRTAATGVQKQAQIKIGNVGFYPQRRGIIGRTATSTGAGVKLRARKYPWGLGAEFGERDAHVYGRLIRQSTFKRRTMGLFKPPTSTDMRKNRGGYMIQPTLKWMLPKIDKTAARDMTRLIMKAQRKAGVKTRG